jgi:hypothetical protein
MCKGLFSTQSRGIGILSNCFWVNGKDWITRQATYENVCDSIDTTRSNKNLWRCRARDGWTWYNLPSLAKWQAHQAKSERNSNEAGYTQDGRDLKNPCLPRLEEDTAVEYHDDAFEAEDQDNTGICQSQHIGVGFRRYILGIP